MELQPFISIIILKYHYPDKKFIRCMKSYTNQDYKNYEIILILCGKKEFYDITKLLQINNINFEKIKIFEYSENLGYARGNNIGVQKAKGDYVLISNPDIETMQDFLKSLIKSFQFLERFNSTDKLIVGPRICNIDRKYEHSRRKINFLGFSNIDVSKTVKIRRTMISSGCAFLIKKKYYEDLGGFDESYFMYHEDIDFSIRATLLGIKQYVDNSIHLYHLRLNEDFKLTKFKYYFHERNRLRMTLEHSKKKNKMFLTHLFFEPFHIMFALMNGFMKERLKVYKYMIQNFSRIMRNKRKENNIFDRYYEMEGIFNEVNPKSITFKLIDFFSKVLFYFYHHS